MINIIFFCVCESVHLFTHLLEFVPVRICTDQYGMSKILEYMLTEISWFEEALLDSHFYLINRKESEMIGVVCIYL